MLPRVRGKQSTTLAFVIIAFSVLIFRFAFAGQDVFSFGAVPPMSGGEFAAAFSAVLGVWQVREYKAKSIEMNTGENTNVN